MSAKGITLMTYGCFVAMAAAAIVFVFTGTTWNGGNETAAWMLFGAFFIYLLGFFIFNRKWATTKSTAQYLRAFDGTVTMEEAVHLLQKYSYLLLVGSLMFLIAGVSALVVY
ncbi:hypothetical protein KFL01_14790 [Kocuria flava]|nr:hypothetical protein KFL01_14790 [Kocuria flava]